MKVLCIKKDGDWIDKIRNDIEEGPQFGEECIVNRVHEDYYILRGYPQNKSYAPKWFIPVSDIDETEMERKDTRVFVIDSNLVK